MRLRDLCVASLGAAVLAAPIVASPALAQNEQFVPLLVYRTGPYAPNGIPLADGQVDYLKLINARDGGINGVTITFEECETQYNNDRGVECYERLKGNGPTGASAFSPFSTGITYALIDRATTDQIPVLSMGYGRADASDGTVFPYVFTLPATYWGQADALIQYISAQEDGNLEGKKIALVYHDSAYGKEPITTLERLSKERGFELSLFPVAHPGLEQKATWLQIGRQLRPDWVLMWGWGVMNSTAIKEAAAVGYPMDRFVGVWWSGAEPDVEPAAAAAKGYKSGAFHAPGADSQMHKDIQELLGDDAADTFGTVLYNRGVINSAIVVEAIRTAMAKYGNKPMTGEQVRWGFENLDLTPERIEEMGMTGFLEPLKITCEDHEGGGKLMVQQWNGEAWEVASDWIEPNREPLRAAYEESAAKYAAEQGITPRDCSKVE